MSNEIVVRVFNFLVHYGENDSKNFRHLMADGFFNLVDQESLTNSKGKTAYLDKITYIQVSQNFYFTGLFYKEAPVNIDHQKANNKKAVNNPVKADAYPRAFFI